MHILVACHHLVAAGGLLRFERVAAAARGDGHTLAYAVDGDKPAEFDTALAVLTFEQAAQRRWDAVLVPGAGFPPETISGFSRFRGPCFGVRVQMVLNDPQIRQRFLAVNAAFAPDIVIFNSKAWPPGSYRDFSAKRFHHLIGAVDVGAFAFRPHAPASDRFVIGAQISKNPGAVLAALEALPPEFVLRWFGFDRSAVETQARARFGGRVTFAGPLLGDWLAAYYRDIDAMVSPESHAGWANVVAEAMCAGVPVVTTPAGTLSIADADTALVLAEATPQAIAEALGAIRADPEAARRRCAAARTRIEGFDWRSYSRALIGIVAGFDGKAHYTHAPEIGLYGKALPQERLDGLDRLLGILGGKTVLDLGAAEGLIAGACLKAGARRVDALELDADRVAIARAAFAGVRFAQGDLASAQVRATLTARAPAGGYDIVLYLGVHHHLPREAQLDAARELAGLARERIVVRTTVEAHGELQAAFALAGFRLEHAVEPPSGSFAGPLRVYRRAAT